jgi:hypothetical protein
VASWTHPPLHHSTSFISSRCLLTTPRPPPLQTKPQHPRFGAVEEVSVFKERRTHQSKGCGFVKMATRGQAVAAMDALDETHLMVGAGRVSCAWSCGPGLRAAGFLGRGCQRRHLPAKKAPSNPTPPPIFPTPNRPTQEGAAAPLSVKWADPDLQVKKRQAVEDSHAENRMVRGRPAWAGRLGVGGVVAGYTHIAAAAVASTN